MKKLIWSCTCLLIGTQMLIGGIVLDRLGTASDRGWSVGLIWAGLLVAGIALRKGLKSDLQEENWK